MSTVATDLTGPAAVRGFFAERAAAVDSGEHDTRAALRFLGEHGALDLRAGTVERPAVDAAATLIAEVAAECLSSAFSLWAHRMVLEYLARGQSTPYIDATVDRLRAGRAIGSSAMSTALRDSAGLEPLPLIAEAQADGLRLSGRIPWASNLFEDAVLVAPARAPEGPGRVVVVFDLGAPGVSVAPPSTLLALNGTASSSLTLDGVHIAPDAVLSTDLAAFMRSVRPTFLILQTAFCLGVAGRCLDEAAARAGGANIELAGDVEHQQAALDELRSRARRLIADLDAAPLRDCVVVRLEAAGAAIAAARLEATVTGGAGYVAASATSRRLRETAFLPIQTPTEGHLRWELQNSL